MQVYLQFSRSLARPNSFIWIPEIETIRCRIKVASVEVSPVDVHLRYRGRGKAYGLVHCHPINGDTFICEAAELHEDLPRIELVLCNVPESVAADLRAL